VPNPANDSIEVLEDIIIDYLTEMVLQPLVSVDSQTYTISSVIKRQR
jgi:hypothetical protein